MDEKASSIGFKSGEYAGRYNNRAAVTRLSDTGCENVGWHTHRNQLRSVLSHLDHGEWSSYRERRCCASLERGLVVGPGTEHEK